jgi:hypothetical protein
VRDFCDWLDSFLSLEATEWGILIALVVVLIITFIKERKGKK